MAKTKKQVVKKEITTVTVTIDTKKKLDKFGNKGESYDNIINNLLKKCRTLHKKRK
jgi:hypothetical protein